MFGDGRIPTRTTHRFHTHGETTQDHHETPVAAKFILKIERGRPSGASGASYELKPL